MLPKLPDLALAVAVTTFIHVHYVLAGVFRALIPADLKRRLDMLAFTWEVSATRLLLILVLTNTGIWMSQIRMLIPDDGP